MPVTPPPPKGIGSIQWRDLWKGFIKVTGGLIVGLFIKTVQDKAFPTYSQIEPLLEACIYFFASYIGINTATNNVGQLFKKDKPTVPISTDTLQDLKEKANQNT